MAYYYQQPYGLNGLHGLHGYHGHGLHGHGFHGHGFQGHGWMPGQHHYHSQPKVVRVQQQDDVYVALFMIIIVLTVGPFAFLASRVKRSASNVSPSDHPDRAQYRSPDQHRSRPPSMPTASPNNGPPPSKPYIIDELPMIALVEKDLRVRPACPICQDKFAIGDSVMRLPCAHVYHENCIDTWLLKHCTCPMCRWEFPTDDRAYEAERVCRMAGRVPRFYRWELERTLPMKALKKILADAKTDPYRPTERADLVQHLLTKGYMEAITESEATTTSEPVTSNRDPCHGDKKEAPNKEKGTENVGTIQVETVAEDETESDSRSWAWLEEGWPANQ